MRTLHLTIYADGWLSLNAVRWKGLTVLFQPHRPAKRGGPEEDQDTEGRHAHAASDTKGRVQARALVHFWS